VQNEDARSVTLRQTAARWVLISLVHSFVAGIGIMAVVGWPGPWPNWVIWPGGAAFITLLVRSLAVSVTFEEQGIRIRNPCRTYRIARQEVVYFGGGHYYIFAMRMDVGAAVVHTNRRRVPRTFGPQSWAKSPFNPMELFGTPRPPLTVPIAASGVPH
jgi:hypothetical protein